MLVTIFNNRWHYTSFIFKIPRCSFRNFIYFLTTYKDKIKNIIISITVNRRRQHHFLNKQNNEKPK